jgi:hypothetical protein
VLVEFALIALAFYLLMAATIEIGRMILASQILQNAARVGARELALFPLPPTYSFEEALADEDVRDHIYDPAKLCFDVAGKSQAQIDAEISGWPIVNRMLSPLMLREEIQVNGTARELLHYPGALVQGPGSGGEYPYLVVVPQVTTVDGVEEVEFLQVVEEVVPRTPVTGDPIPERAPFSLAEAPGKRERGLVALRVNYPFQAAMFSLYSDPEDLSSAVLADDDAVVVVNPTATATISSASTEDPDEGGLYHGRHGLGRHYALIQEVRPYRRLLSAQSLFRRETYAPEPPP